jgi:CDP-diacylglycerol---serine O-phosphatidyltransferase
MLRDFSLADLVTLANGSAGMGSVLASIAYLDSKERWLLWLAFGLLPFSLVFDYADGKIARWRRKHSPLGAQLDSLADLVSFGVAPAVLGFAMGMRGGIDALVLIYFVSAGISRLARYNVTAAELSDEGGKVKYFEGTPIPTSLLLVAILAVLLGLGKSHAELPFGVHRIAGFELHPLVAMYFVSGSAMISKTLRIPKL